MGHEQASHGCRQQKSLLMLTPAGELQLLAGRNLLFQVSLPAADPGLPLPAQLLPLEGTDKCLTQFF